MSDPTHPPISELELQRHLPKRKLGCIPLAILALVALIGLPAIGLFSWGRVAKREVEKRIAALEEKGEPVSAADLHAFYPYPPEDRDATTLWLDAGRAFASISSDNPLPLVGAGEDPPPPGSQWELLEQTEELLATYANEMEMSHEAAAIGGQARYATKFEDGFWVTLTHMQNTRAICRMLSLEAYVRAHRGDARGAAQSLQTGLLAAASCRHEPLIVSQLVSIACVRMMTKTLQDLLPNTDFTDDDLAMLQRTYRDFDVRRQLNRGLQGERVIAIIAFRDPARLYEEVEGPSWFFTTLGSRHEDLAMYLDLMEKVIAAAEQPWPKAIVAAEQVSRETDRLISGNPLQRMRYALTAMAFPATKSYFTAGARGEATIKAADAIIAAKRFQTKHGRFPNTWNDLVPEFLESLPEDPFSQQPMHLVVRDQRCLIYSIGTNQLDDGGSTKAPNNEELDLVMELISK